jgi:hypothetical protein
MRRETRVGIGFISVFCKRSENQAQATQAPYIKYPLFCQLATPRKKEEKKEICGGENAAFALVCAMKCRHHRCKFMLFENVPLSGKVFSAYLRFGSKFHDLLSGILHIYSLSLPPTEPSHFAFNTSD